MDNILKFLFDLGIMDISLEDKKIIEEKLKNNISEIQIKKEFLFLYNLNLVLASSYGEVSLANMNKINEKIDSNTLLKLFIMHERIRDKALNEEEVLVEFKKVACEILGVNNKVNKLIVSTIREEQKKIIKIKNVLSLSISDEKKVEQIIENCKRRVSKFIQKCDISNIESIVRCLKENYYLSDDELVKISSECATIFCSSSTYKINNIYNTIDDFKQFIIKGLDGNKDLLTRDFKDVLINSTSLVTSNPSTISKTVKFLMNVEIDELVECDEVNELRKIRGDFSYKQLAKIYNDSITTLSTSVEKMLNMSRELGKVYEKYFDKELNVTGLINGNNFTSIKQVSEDDYRSDGKIKEMFFVLSRCLSEQGMENLLKNDFSFLKASLIDFKASLKEAALNSKNEEEFKKNVLKKIRNHFDMYKGQFPASILKGEVSGFNEIKLKEVDFKNVSKEEIEQILSSLKVDEVELNEWKSRWKDEAIYKEMELEEDLNSIYRDLKAVEETIDVSFTNLDDYKRNIDDVKEFLFEVVAKYNQIKDNNLITKNLRGYLDEVESLISSISNKINANVDEVIKVLQDHVKALEDSANSEYAKIERHVYYKEKIEELDDFIYRSDIKESDVEKIKEKIEEAYDSVRSVKKKLSVICKNEERANKLADLFLGGKKSKHKINPLIINEEVKKIDRDVYVLELFKLFVSILDNEGLIMYTDDISTIKIPTNLNYEQFRDNCLNEEQMKITDEIYSLYQENMDIKEAVYDDFVDYLHYFRVDVDEVDTVFEACNALKNFLAEYSDKVNTLDRKINDRNKYIKNYQNMDIDSIKKKLNDLVNLINNYLYDIESLKNIKIL